MSDEMPKMKDLVIQDARLLFRNFAGRVQQFNSEGDRNFCVLLEPELAEDLRAAGFNIKELRAKEEGDVPQAYMQVAVNYKSGRPPRVVLITSNNRVDLGADEVEMLDYADLALVDLVINPYPWKIKSSGTSGVKAYLKTAFVTLNENELDRKYAQSAAVEPTTVSSSTANEED